MDKVKVSRWINMRIIQVSSNSKDEEIKDVYKDLSTAINKRKSIYPVIMDDFNGKVKYLLFFSNHQNSIAREDKVDDKNR